VTLEREGKLHDCDLYAVVLRGFRTDVATTLAQISWTGHKLLLAPQSRVWVATVLPSDGFP
jgi:hypothetical protein